MNDSAMRPGTRKIQRKLACRWFSRVPGHMALRHERRFSCISSGKSGASRKSECIAESLCFVNHHSHHIKIVVHAIEKRGISAASLDFKAEFHIKGNSRNIIRAGIQTDPCRHTVSFAPVNQYPDQFTSDALLLIFLCHHDSKLAVMSCLDLMGRIGIVAIPAISSPSIASSIRFVFVSFQGTNFVFLFTDCHWIFVRFKA